MRVSFRIQPAAILLACALPLGCNDRVVHEMQTAVDLDGAVAKGPFVLGSSVNVSTVDESTNPTGQVFPTKTTDDLGDFDLTFPYQGFVSIEGTGFYYNEATGKLSNASLTLRALYNVTSAPSQQAYVNIITHLTFDRVKQLVRGQALPPDQAAVQAETELRTQLGIGGSGFDPRASGVQMSIAGGDNNANAYLFAVSAIMAEIAVAASNGASVDATLQELINTLSSSFAESGQVDPGLVQQIVSVQEKVNPQTIMDMLQQRFNSIQSSATVPDLNRVWDSNGNGIPNKVDHACSIGFHDGGDAVCVPDGSCSAGYHDGGAGQCVAAGTCSTGYQNGGNGACQPSGVCSSGYHDGGSGSCVPVGTCSVGHDGGDGVCVPAGTCSTGFLVCSSDCLTSRFRNGASYTVGNQPEGVATGDFNGDAKVDLVLANTAGDSFSILLGNGDGTFQPAVTSSTGAVAGSAPGPVAVGDFNGDNKLDVAIADVVNPDIRVMLGKGDGSFQKPIASPSPTPNKQPHAMLAGDLNGDTKLDVILVSPDWGQALVLLGNGDGTFSPEVAYPTGTQPWALTSGDFNGDHRLDVAVTNRGDNNVTVLLGNGDGTLQSPVPYPTGPGPVGVASGDFNGDHKLDLAVANYNNESTGTVSILLGNGDGTFQPQVPYGAGNGPWPLIVGDFNGDNRVDVLVIDFAGNGSSVSLLFGNADGTLQPALMYAFANAQTLVAANFTGGGNLDIALVDSNTNTLSVELNNGCAP